jgi:hypothetical protein
MIDGLKERVEAENSEIEMQTFQAQVQNGEQALYESASRVELQELLS